VLEIAPDGLDVVEFRRVLGQPFDGELMGAVGKRGDGGLAHVDRPVVEHDDDRPDRQAGPRAIKAVRPNSAMKSALCLVLLVCTMSRRAG